jgi:hypothetical protein
VRWGAAGACGGLIVALVLLGVTPGDSGDLDGVAGVVASVGAVVNYAGVVAVTLAGGALTVVGWRLPGWRRGVLLLVPFTWVVTVALWTAAFLTGILAID